MPDFEVEVGMISWFIKPRKERSPQIEQPENNGLRIKCDCCGIETMAQIRGNKLIIMDKRHGKKHIVVLSIEDLVSVLKEFEPAHKVLITE
jgi:hypothetical protein